jgi:hypothetical protein
MTALSRTPSNTNFLQPSKFILAFNRLPTIQYFCQEANLPGVSIGTTEFATPLVNVPIAGTKIDYQEFDITFLIDEQAQSWNELYKWLLSIASPKSTVDRYNNNALQNTFTSTNSYYSDSNLTIMSALNNPLISINFHRMFPVSLSSIQFDTKLSADTILTATATFRYEYFEITNY